MEISRGWEFWIDRGGTFTDFVARRPDGQLVTHKILSVDPAQYDDAALAGIRDLLGVARTAPLPSERIAAVKMGTTVATNALLERKGDRCALVITRGLGDALKIGYQNRPRIFDRHIVLPEQVYERVVEVNERMTAEGETLQPLDAAQAERDLRAVFAAGIRSVAIVLMHGYRYPAHEQALRRLAKEIGFTQISVSHELSPLVRLVSRGDTTTVDAYLSPILHRHIAGLRRELGNARLLFMQSNGGLADARNFQGKDSILSGPAGGIVGAVQTSVSAGFDRLIGFDMGGTSTDVSHFNGEYERSSETEVAGVRIRVPMMSIHTVAAGGGSILRFDGQRYRVGPASAGAHPGPAAYRKGGPLTVTDANVLLGKIQPSRFPRVFGPRGDEPLDPEATRAGFARLAAELREQTGLERSVEEIAEGFLTIAVENMANAIKKISVERGYDVTAYTLACFGGAGGQHACLVANALGMKRVYLHPYAGVLSAYGMGLADLGVIKEGSVEAPLTEAILPELRERLAVLAEGGVTELAGQGVPRAGTKLVGKAQLRYEGTDASLAVTFAEAAAMAAEFEAQHRQRFGFALTGRRLLVTALSAELIAVSSESAGQRGFGGMANGAKPAPLETVQMFSGGRWHATPLYSREALPGGTLIDGPAILIEPVATTVVEPGWRARVTDRADLVLERVQAVAEARVSNDARPDPVRLEVFGNLFMSIAEQMGVTLANTSHSVNIKERFDFSCALFDREGNLIANAPHIPVHLGSMSDSIRAVATEHAATLRPGDVYLLNSPYHGGTHLPDVTAVTPVFDEAGRELLFYVASRGHHADIGGVTPGSVPPHSRTIEEEGVLIRSFKLVDAGRFREVEARELLGSGPWPARNIDQNLADLRAQVAANNKGVQELLRMMRQFGRDAVVAYMGHVQDNAEAAVRGVIDRLRDGSFTYEMDDGAKIQVAIRVDRAARGAVIDFTGTSPQLDTNFNAPASIAKAATMYVFRSLLDDDIPLNEGCLKPLQIVIPEGSLLNPRYPAAVVSGNVETSQCVTDALYGALGVMGAAQGTMNNFTFGDEEYQYYETICGGAGAGPDFDGADAVHTHMTNSRLTDPEILESRYPVLLAEFCVREGSGGAGAHRGGHGVRRKVVFRRPMTAGIISGHRRVPPYGMAGGGSGAVGVNAIERKDGTREHLGGVAQARLEPGDAFVIETPGGGGYGAPPATEK
jgi:5-oxoprolinase (ATP-hydrolysing)